MDQFFKKIGSEDQIFGPPVRIPKFYMSATLPRQRLLLSLPSISSSRTQCPVTEGGLLGAL